MLRLDGLLMSDTLEELLDMTRHQDVEAAFFVVPTELGPAV